ncbi:NAD(P)H-binding protein [Lactococcus raffinolactis]|uniref:NAD(P)-dependent oxidoreductase n=1 Tax=Pseudolactococcus raffinolactis TaxID=1366 RepID=UPI0014369BAD|nr:NAD(P)H-binding protein [Lactococcus raffinolactis]QIW59779.1 NAD(P)H-binding protein [Lactococcus raffinolactis]
MNKFLVVAANGKAGQKIVTELMARGLDVTVAVRQANKTQASQVIIKDLFDLTAADVSNFDVVIDAFGAWAPEALPQHTSSLEHLAAILAPNARLLVVGGAGSLYLDASHTAALKDSDGFPEAFKPLASAMGEGLARLRTLDVDWTYLSPAADFVVDGEKKGHYVIEGEVLTTDDKGVSQLSYADYATAVVDIATSGRYHRERVSVRW